MNLSSAVRTAKSVITANSPVLLVGAAVAGVVTTGVLAAKGGYKARGIVDAAREEAGGVEPTVQEKFKLTWLCYAAPAVTGVSTIASVVGVHTIHTKRHAALAGLYAVTTSKMDDYREKAEEMLGAKKAQLLNDSTAQAEVDKNPVVDHEVLILGSGGDELCYDRWSGRWFKGSMAVVDRAIAEANLQLVESGDLSLNELYDYLGLKSIEAANGMGWQQEKISATYGSVNSHDGRPAIAVSFQSAPKPIL